MRRMHSARAPTTSGCALMFFFRSSFHFLKSSISFLEDVFFFRVSGGCRRGLASTRQARAPCPLGLVKGFEGIGECCHRSNQHGDGSLQLIDLVPRAMSSLRTVHSLEFFKLLVAPELEEVAPRARASGSPGEGDIVIRPWQTCPMLAVGSEMWRVVSGWPLSSSIRSHSALT